MSASGTLRRVLAGAVILVAALVVLPAPGHAIDAGYTGWVQREDGATPGTDTTVALSGADVALNLVTAGRQVGVYDHGDNSGMSANFYAAAGQILQAGQTYRADVASYDSGSTAAGFVVWRGMHMCGRTEEELFPPPYREHAKALTGWFHVSELERDGRGNVTRFAATYEVNCQYVGGQPGFEGSVAVSSSQAAVPVPEAPAAPGAVTGLTAKNVGPNGGGQNTTTLTWTNPAGAADVTIDLVQLKRPFPTLLDTDLTKLYRGRASRYTESMIDFMDTRTYRLVARGATGRLGPATYLTVLGTRLSTKESTRRIMIGQTVGISGRLSESWDYTDFADVMDGPGLAGRTVLLCEQSSVHYVDGACTEIDRATTSADGHFTMSATPRANKMYSVVLPATSDLVGNSSPEFITKVAPQTDLEATESADRRLDVPRTFMSDRASTRSVRRGSVIHFTTSRARAGSRGVVYLQRLDGKKWHTVVTAHLDRSSGRRLAVPYREHARGLHAYRVVKPGDARHVNGVSPTLHIQVR